MSDWMPIETAPKDGTAVLLGFDYSGRFVRYIGHWHRELGAWARDEVTSAFFPAHMQAWFSLWRPLPEPPVATQGRE